MKKIMLFLLVVVFSYGFVESADFYDQVKYLCGSGEFKLQDDSDGKGPYIKEWNCSNLKPTVVELNALDTDPVFVDKMKAKKDRMEKYSKDREWMIDQIEILKAKIAVLEGKVGP